MDYCTPIFGNSLDTLSYSQIHQYFQIERGESDLLEFKAFHGKIEEGFSGIIRSICGFLNSKGGILIWGAPAGKKIDKRNEYSYIGPLTPIDVNLEKDRVLSKVVDSIVPLPAAVKARILEDCGKCVCIFEVNESEYSPHQTRGTYYMRIDGQTKPAPHHYIEALFRKIRFPNLEGYLKIGSVGVQQMHNNLAVNIHPFFFNWSEMQNVEDLSFRVSADKGQFFQTNTSEARRISVHKVLHFGQPYTESLLLLVNRQLLAERGYNVYLFLFFGARNTPSKISEYELNLSQYDPRLDGEAYVTNRRENMLFKDHQDSKGVTKEKALDVVLGRRTQK